METFESLLSQLSDAEVQFQYVKFLKSLPQGMLPTKRCHLIRIVSNALKIPGRKADLSFEAVNDKGDQLLDLLGIELGYSVRVLCPPVSECILCDKRLANRTGSPVQVVMHDTTGPSMFTKYSYRCNACYLVYSDLVTDEHKANKQNVNYNVHTYGNTKNGNFHYQERAQNVKASEEVFMTKDLVEFYLNLRNHSQVSYEGFSESYNETWRGQPNVAIILKFLEKNPDLKKRFDKNLEKSEEIFQDNDNEKVDSEVDLKPRRQAGTSFTGFHELHRKNVSNAVNMYEIQNEMEEREELTQFPFGPYNTEKGTLVTFKESIEQYLGN